jgi:D-alanine-D-alanine ligase
VLESPRLKVVVLLADPDAPYPGRGDEDTPYDGTDDANAVLMNGLEAAGFEATLQLVHLGNVERVVEALECDVVFNLCEGNGAERDGMPGVEVIEALERRGLPYTGARAEFYRLTYSKVAIKQRFREAGVPTPAFQAVRSPGDRIDPSLARRFPLIVKPSDSGGSAGIHLRSVVGDLAELGERVAEVCSVYGDALVEEYIDGREITVALLGEGRAAKLFPPLEMCFGPAFPPGRRIQTFELKWDDDSPLYSAFHWRCPAPLDAAQRRRLVSVARAAYRAVGGNGYGRVDLRLRDTTPFVLEVNANPSLDWSDDEYSRAEYPIVAAAVGWSYPRLLREIVLQPLELPRRSAAASRSAASRRRRGRSDTGTSGRRSSGARSRDP